VLTLGLSPSNSVQQAFCCGVLENSRQVTCASYGGSCLALALRAHHYHTILMAGQRSVDKLTREDGMPFRQHQNHQLELASL
jgi:hypothetical protein